MIISNSHRFIFIHVHKCAGSTISHALQPTIQWNDIELGVSSYGEAIQSTYRDRFGLWKHSPAFDVRRVVGDQIFGDYFKFAFVRNPFFRVISFYTFIQKLQTSCTPSQRAAIDKWPISRALSGSTSFSEFIRHPDFQEPHMFRLLADRPYNKSLLVDFVGKVEGFEQDFAYVCNRIGVPAPANITRMNASRREGIRLTDYYAGEDDLRFIYEKYHRDFDLFGYSLEESTARYQAEQREPAPPESA